MEIYILLRIKDREYANKIIERILQEFTSEVKDYEIIDEINPFLTWKRKVSRHGTSRTIAVPPFLLKYLGIEEYVLIVLDLISGRVYLTKPEEG